MKRELKGESTSTLLLAPGSNRKAHPDEKGTERNMIRSDGLTASANRKAHPDEKGTESAAGGNSSGAICNRKAHPDEKGTESDITSVIRCLYAIIARLIPMKRELKDHVPGTCAIHSSLSQGSSR